MHRRQAATPQQPRRPVPAAIIFALDKRIAGCIFLIHAARARSRHRAGAGPVDLPSADPACCRQRGLGIKPGSSRDQCGGAVNTVTSRGSGRDHTPSSPAMNRRKGLVSPFRVSAARSSVDTQLCATPASPPTPGISQYHAPI